MSAHSSTPSLTTIDPAAAPVITGLGLVTPLGGSLWETARALLAGRRTADRLAELPEEIDPVTLARATGGSAFATFTLTDPAIELAERAAREALADAGLADAAGALLIVASSKGAVMAALDERATDRRTACMALGPHGYLCAHLQQRLGAESVRAVVAACATSMAAMHLGWWAIREGRARRVVVVAVESALSGVFVHSYRRLGALAPTSPVRAHEARPLDASRCGFTLCECAAAVVMEPAHGSESRATGSRVQARVLGVAIGSEPHDMVRAPEAFSTLARLAEAVTPRDRRIALLQPHATGTVDNDGRELAALERSLGDRLSGAAVYASKGAIGHPLGAAGLVNVALGCVMGRIGRTAPMPWLKDPVPSGLNLTSAAMEIPAGGVQVIAAAGFGGHVGAVCLDVPGR